MQIIKAEKIHSILIYFHCYLLLYFLFGTRFLVNIQYFGNHTSPYSCFFFGVNNHFFIGNDTSMKPLITGLSYDMKAIVLVFCYQKHLFSFHFFLGHIGMKMNKPWKSNKT